MAYRGACCRQTAMPAKPLSSILSSIPLFRHVKSGQTAGRSMLYDRFSAFYGANSLPNETTARWQSRQRSRYLPPVCPVISCPAVIRWRRVLTRRRWLRYEFTDHQADSATTVASTDNRAAVSRAAGFVPTTLIPVTVCRQALLLVGQARRLLAKNQISKLPYAPPANAGA